MMRRAMQLLSLLRKVQPENFAASRFSIITARRTCEEEYARLNQSHKELNEGGIVDSILRD